MSGNMYNANLCFVGAVKGLAKLALPEMIKKAKNQVDKKFHGSFMYTDTDMDALMKALNITDKSLPHFIVVEKDGSIIYNAREILSIRFFLFLRQCLHTLNF
jgi:hypothetical protein